MTAQILKNFAGRWYYVANGQVSDSNWSSRSKALEAARKAGFVNLIG